MNVAGDHRGQPPSYYAPYNIPTLQELENDEEYLTDRLTDEAIAFITKNRTNQFFMYLPFYTVHTPIEPPPEKLTRYEAKAETLNADTSSQRNPGYAGMIESLDDGVGRLLETLNDLDIADRTVVIFASDNGGLVRDEHRRRVFPGVRMAERLSAGLDHDRRDHRHSGSGVSSYGLAVAPLTTRLHWFQSHDRCP